MTQPRILWIATKAPLPSIDGGRAVTIATIEALAAAGARVTIVAPDPGDGARGDGGCGTVRFVQTSSVPRGWASSAWRSLRSGRPLTIERHAHPALAARVAALVRTEAFDVVHAEQLQALAIAAPARAARVPCVLRAQNVESAVWDAARGPRRLEARRLRRYEAAAIGDVEAVIALSPGDAARLTALNGAARITVIPPPAPRAWLAHSIERRPADESAAPDAHERRRHEGARHEGERHESARHEGERRESERRAGDRHEGDRDGARFVWLGSAGWPPNDVARRWLLDEIWPAIAARLPAARLDLFGASERGAHHDTDGMGIVPPGLGMISSRVRASSSARVRRSADSHSLIAASASITARAAPRDSAEAFPPHAILLLPLRTAAGVRIRLLEAWARGVPVIASAAAIDGLDAVDRRDVLLAADPRGFADAAARLAADPALRAQLVAGGRATLARHHDPSAIAAATLAVYRDAIARHGRRPPFAGGGDGPHNSGRVS